MGRTICITNIFDVRDNQGIPTGEKKLLVDYAFDEDTGQAVIVPPEHPSRLGAFYDATIGEYVIS